MCFSLQRCRWHFIMKIQARSLYLCPYGTPSHLCMVVALGVPLGRAKNFFKQCFEFVEHLDRAGGHLAPGGKKALKREVGGHSGRIWLTSQRCLGSTLVQNMNQAVCDWYTLFYHTKKIGRYSPPLLFCKMKSRVYLCVQLLNVTASCGQEEIKFRDDTEKNMPNQEQQQRFCCLNSIIKGKNSEPKMNFAISVEEMLIFLLGNIFLYSQLNFYSFLT